jgi:hypothetical protein
LGILSFSQYSSMVYVKIVNFFAMMLSSVSPVGVELFNG